VGRALQALALGVALGLSWLYVAHAASTAFAFRYQGF
jgi:hypothetical protein